MGVTFQPLTLEGPIKGSKCVDFRQVYLKRNKQNCHMKIISGSDDVARSWWRHGDY